MNAWHMGRIGAALLVLGGAIESAAYGAGSMISLPSTAPLGATLLVAYPLGLALTGAGLIATGIASAVRGRIPLALAGVLAVLGAAVEGVEAGVGSPFGPAPAQAVVLLLVLLLVIAAARRLSDTRLPATARWAIAVPAICFVLDLAAVWVPAVPLQGSVVLPWVGTAVAGVLLLHTARSARTVALPLQG